MIRKYTQFITGTIFGSIVAGVLSAVIAGSTAIANIKENKEDIQECKEEVNKCQEYHQNLLLALNKITANDQKFENLLNQLINKLGHQHALPDYPVK